MSVSRPEIQSLAKGLHEQFGSQVVGALLYGSAIRGERWWDTDLLVVLRAKADVLGDLRRLRALRQEHRRLKLDLQLVYLDEIASQHAFSLDAHGAFLVPVLREAHVVLGLNPYRTVRVSRHALRSSVVRKLQYYVFRARQDAMGVRVPHKDGHSTRFHRKRLILAMQDILLANTGSLISVDAAPCAFERMFPGAVAPSLLRTLGSGKLTERESLLFWQQLYDLTLRLLGPASQ